MTSSLRPVPTPAPAPAGGRGARARTTFAASAAAVALLAAAAAGCSSGTGPDGTAAAPVPTPTVAVVPATVLPVVGNPTNLTVKPAVGAGKGLPPTKLVVKDLVTGTGAPAAATDTVTVNYVGVLWNDGKQFDASWTGGEPATFPLDQVIPGFAQGIGGSVSDSVAGMRVGGRREIVIPPALGYGPQGGQGDIKADDTIVFVVDLLEVAATSATAPVETTAAPDATASAAANG